MLLVVSFLHCQSDWMGTDQEGCDHHSNSGRRLRTTVKYRCSNSSRNLTVDCFVFFIPKRKEYRAELLPRLLSAGQTRTFSAPSSLLRSDDGDQRRLFGLS